MKHFHNDPVHRLTTGVDFFSSFKEKELLMRKYKKLYKRVKFEFEDNMLFYSTYESNLHL